MCSHLIGRQYNYGTTDCIHMVIDALDSMGIKNPGVLEAWYDMTWREILRELEEYCERIKCPTYDGDIVLLRVDSPAFGVTWQNGILYFNQTIRAVDWKPVEMLSIRRCYRMKNR